MKTIVPIMMVLALALITLPVQAAQLTPTLSYDNTDLTTGTSRTISVTVTGSGSAATISSLSLSTSCLTVSDPSGGSYSSFSAATGGTTKDFVVTSGTASTCTFSASSLEQSQNSPSTSSEGTLVFVNPSAIGATVDDDAAGTYSSGQNYTFTVTLVNSLNSSISFGYNITKGSQTTKQTGDLTNNTLTLTAGSSTQLNWSFSSTSTDSLYLYIGDRLAHTAAVTITSSSSSSSSSSGGGGASTSTGGATASFAIDKIAAGASVTKTIAKAAIPVTELKIEVLEQVTLISLTVTALSSQPSSVTAVPAAETVYQFIEITKTNLDDKNIKSASLTFTVNESWVTVNNIDRNRVSLLRYANGSWQRYPATLAIDGDTLLLLTYTASVPGFSVFAISGEKTDSPVTTPTPTPSATQSPQATPSTTSTSPTESGGSLPLTVPDITLWLIAGVIFVVVVAALVLKMKK